MPSDLAIGTSIRKRWQQMLAKHDLLSTPLEDMHLERARGRNEIVLLRQERDLLKKRRPSSFVRQGDAVCTQCYAEGRHVFSTPVLLRGGSSISG